MDPRTPPQRPVAPSASVNLVRPRISLSRDLTRARQRYLRLGKSVLVERLLALEHAYAEQEERWLRVNDELLTWQLGAEFRDGSAPNVAAYCTTSPTENPAPTQTSIQIAPWLKPSQDSYTTGSRRRTARSRTARRRGSRPWPTRRPPSVLARTRRHSRLASAGRRPASDSSPILHGRWGDRPAGRFDEGGNRLQCVSGPFESVQAGVDAIQRLGVAQCSHRPDPTGSARVHVIGSRAGTSGYARASHTRRLFRVR